MKPISTHQGVNIFVFTEGEMVDCVFHPALEDSCSSPTLRLSIDGEELRSVHIIGSTPRELTVEIYSEGVSLKSLTWAPEYSTGQQCGVSCTFSGLQV